MSCNANSCRVCAQRDPGTSGQLTHQSPQTTCSQCSHLTSPHLTYSRIQSPDENDLPTTRHLAHFFRFLTCRPRRAPCRQCHIVLAMFDQSSGQVYKEWTVPSQSLSSNGGDRDWSRRRPYPLFTPRGTKGPRSLIDMATNIIANNIGDVTEEHLDPIPIRLLWRIWRFLEARLVFPAHMVAQT